MSWCWRYPTRNQTGWEIRRFQLLQSVELFEVDFYQEIPAQFSRILFFSLSDVVIYPELGPLAYLCNLDAQPGAISDLIMIF